MTKSEWDAMDAREKDKLVALKVMLVPLKAMGWVTIWPSYTTDRNACVLVLDELEKRGAMHQFLLNFVEITPCTYWDCLRADPDTICYCALKAVEDESD